MVFSFRYFVLCHPIPLRLLVFVAIQFIMLAMGSVGQEKLACALRVEINHLERNYSTLCCYNFRYLFLCYPTPLCLLAFVAIQSIMLAMGSVGQEKLACVLRVEINHLERNYSTLCCYNFRYLFLCHPTPLRLLAFVAIQSIKLVMGSVG